MRDKVQQLKLFAATSEVKELKFSYEKGGEEVLSNIWEKNI